MELMRQGSSIYVLRGDVIETGESFAIGEIPTREGRDLRQMLRNLVPVARNFIDIHGRFPTAWKNGNSEEYSHAFSLLPCPGRLWNVELETLGGIQLEADRLGTMRQRSAGADPAPHRAPPTQSLSASPHPISSTSDP